MEKLLLNVSVGKVCGETCISLSNGNDRDFQYIQELDTVVKEELVLRLSTELESNPTICQRHKEKFILNWYSNSKKCCDTYKKHKKAVTKRQLHWGLQRKQMAYTCILFLVKRYVQAVALLYLKAWR